MGIKTQKEHFSNNVSVLKVAKRLKTTLWSWVNLQKTLARI